MTDIAIVLAFATLVVGIGSALLVRLLPSVRLQLIGLDVARRHLAARRRPRSRAG